MSGPRLLTIMGSGETAPTMVKVHRGLLERVGGPAVLLDTPYGFQENADDISEKAQGYFRESVGHTIDVASYRSLRCRRARRGHRRPAAPGRALRVRRPGQPHVRAAPVGRHRRARRRSPPSSATAGAVTFASAAALTLGRWTVPVYEIYKAGEAPRWLDGLDLLGAATGLQVAVIPHYDNAEGGHHDTRFCYLGERRLSRLERELPDGRVRARRRRAHGGGVRPRRRLVSVTGSAA